MACNSLSYTPFDSVLLCLYLCVSFDLLKSVTICLSDTYINMCQLCNAMFHPLGQVFFKSEGIVFFTFISLLADFTILYHLTSRMSQRHCILYYKGLLNKRIVFCCVCAIMLVEFKKYNIVCKSTFFLEKTIILHIVLTIKMQIRFIALSLSPQKCFNNFDPNSKQDR